MTKNSSDYQERYMKEIHNTAIVFRMIFHENNKYDL